MTNQATFPHPLYHGHTVLNILVTQEAAKKSLGHPRQEASYHAGVLRTATSHDPSWYECFTFIIE